MAVLSQAGHVTKAMLYVSPPSGSPGRSGRHGSPIWALGLRSSGVCFAPGGVQVTCEPWAPGQTQKGTSPAGFAGADSLKAVPAAAAPVCQPGGGRPFDSLLCFVLISCEFPPKYKVVRVWMWGSALLCSPPVAPWHFSPQPQFSRAFVHVFQYVFFSSSLANVNALGKARTEGLWCSGQRWTAIQCRINALGK